MSVQRRQWLRHCSVLVLVVASLASGPLRAQGLKVRSSKVLNDVELELRIKSVDGSVKAVAGADRQDMRVGMRLLVCFRASRDGYVTLRSRPEGPMGLLERIYPNAYMEGAESMSVVKRSVKAIEGGQELCIGREEDTCHLEVAGSVGESGIRPRYTREMDDQFDETAYHASLRAESGVPGGRVTGRAGGNTGGE